MAPDGMGGSSIVNNWQSNLGIIGGSAIIGLAAGLLIGLVVRDVFSAGLTGLVLGGAFGLGYQSTIDEPADTPSG